LVSDRPLERKERMAKLTRGQIRYFARQSVTPVYSVPADRWGHGFAMYASVPVFADNRTNRAIDAHETRIRNRRTFRRRPGPTAADWS